MKRALLILIVALGGCATGYQTGKHFTGGFEETALAPNIYRVRFEGNGYTSEARAEDLALLRSADLTLQKGFKYFGLADASSSSSLSSYQTPTTTTTNANASVVGNSIYGTATSTTYGGNTVFVSKPSAVNLVVMMDEKPESGLVFDAAFICGSMGPKYKAACGTK